MTIRPIIEVPDARLRKISAPVAVVDDTTRALMDDMLDSMYAANGIGLAAVQIGNPIRVIVMDLSYRNMEEEKEEDEAGEEVREAGEEKDEARVKETGPRYFVNPVLEWVSDETRNYQEGCLSVPGFYDDVERPARCRVAFLDYDGTEQKLECDGILATCIQHEMDHLEGVVFLDHLSRLKRDIILKKLRKQHALAQ